MKKNIVKMSLVTVMVLTTGAYANQIIGAEPNDPRTDNIQFGYGGLNMENINVIQTLDGVENPIDFAGGAYDPMALEDTYQSSVFAPGDDKSDEATRLGYITQKIWPISEPSGLKVVNNDNSVNRFKPTNCIMSSSYLGDANESDADDTTFYLDDANPSPTLCGSYAGSSKRFQLVLNDNIVTEPDNEGYMGSIDLVFNIDQNADKNTTTKYQVFQKVSNFTNVRFDGLKIEVLKGTGASAVEATADLNISLGLGEGNPNEGSGNIFEEHEMAFYPPGIWGYNATKPHLPLNGWFDDEPDGYIVTGHGTNTIVTTTKIDGNYEALFGNWAPDRWVPHAMHEDIDPTIEPVLLAYWGTTPTNPDAEPAWYYGEWSNPDENGDQVKTNFAPVPAEELQKWAADLRSEDNPDGKFVIADIEDIPNLSLNYIINVGENIDSNFTIRFTPKISADQTPPSYFEDNDTRIDPVLDVTAPIITLLGTTPVSVTQGDVYTDAGATASDDVDGDITANIVTNNPVDTATVGIYTVTYNVTDATGNAATEVTRSVIVTLAPPSADDVVPVNPIEPAPSSSGGGCTYNPNSKSFDMTFLMMMALGLLYPFRRRFIK